MSGAGSGGLGIVQSVHAPVQRIVELVVGQIFSQLGIEHFQSAHVLRVLGDILLERLEDWSVLFRIISDHIKNHAVPDNNEDWFFSSHALTLKLFLKMELGSLNSISLNELISYAKIQGFWIDTIMDKLASIEGHAGGRRMLPPEALLTLFSTLPTTIRPAVDISTISPVLNDMEIVEPFYLSFIADISGRYPPLPSKTSLSEKIDTHFVAAATYRSSEPTTHVETLALQNIQTPAPEIQFRGVLSQVKRNFSRFSEDSGEDCEENIDSVPVGDLDLEDSEKYALFARLVDAESKDNCTVRPHVLPMSLSREKMPSSLLDYEVFTTGGVDGGGNLPSPSVLMIKNPLMRLGFVGQTQQPQLFQRVAMLRQDCGFILDYFMSYPLLASRTFEEKKQMMNNFLFSTPLITSLGWGEGYSFSGNLGKRGLGLELLNFTRHRLLYSLSNAAMQSVGIEFWDTWLPELVDSVLSRKRATLTHDAQQSLLITLKMQSEPHQEDPVPKKIFFKPKPFVLKKIQDARLRFPLDKLKSKRPKVLLRLPVPPKKPVSTHKTVPGIQIPKVLPAQKIKIRIPMKRDSRVSVDNADVSRLSVTKIRVKIPPK